ncbi:MAG TPA: hypothetical protein PKD53_07565 [Chloroflexaceae bacterium]|nr:hypothetical protein [Chloroflexaceae bacterium]
MARTPRIGLQIDHADPSWVPVREAIWRQGQLRAAEVIELPLNEPTVGSGDEAVELVEDLVVQEFDPLIYNTYPADLQARILAPGSPSAFVRGAWAPPRRAP